MLALKLLWIFTIGAAIFIGTTLVVCLVVSLIQSHQVQQQQQPVVTAKGPIIVRDLVPVNCFRLIQGDAAEQRRAAQYQKFHQKTTLSNEGYTNMTSDCAKFIKTRGYFTYPTSNDEVNYPLAFDMLVSKDVELFERLLRAVYRPQNVYCVHVDGKADSTLHEAVNDIAGCFDNVFVLGNSTVHATTGIHLLPQPDILCMEALLKYKKWRYFISLTEQQFPLRTNWELVQILKTLEGVTIIDANINLPTPDQLIGDLPPRIDVSSLRPPVHIVAKRHFVQFVVNDDAARQALNWTQPARLPSRFYFAPVTNQTQTQTGMRSFIDRYKVNN